MKLFATLALAAMTAVPLFAASIPRCDITGLDKAGKVKLTPGKIEGGLRVSNQNWGAEETRPFRLTAAGKAIGPEWTRCKLTFIPESCSLPFADSRRRRWRIAAGLRSPTFPSTASWFPMPI